MASTIPNTSSIIDCRGDVLPSGIYTQIHNASELENPESNVVICPPQFMTTLSRGGSLVLSELALRTDSIVYGYDHPGTGSSRSLTTEERKALHTEVGYAPTAHAVWKDIKRVIPNVEKRKLVVAGNSMGAYAGVQIMAVAAEEGVENIGLGVISEAAAIIDERKTVLEGLSKYGYETLRAKNGLPYEVSEGISALPEAKDRLIDKNAFWAYVDAFRRTTTRQAIHRAFATQPEMNLVTIHGGASLLSPVIQYDSLVPEQYQDRWLDVNYVPSSHNITDNSWLFAYMVSSYLNDFGPLPSDQAEPKIKELT